MEGKCSALAKQLGQLPYTLEGVRFARGARWKVNFLLTDGELHLLDADGETEYHWMRVREP